MSLLMGKMMRIIEKPIISREVMEMPLFPCFKIDLSKSVNNLIQQFIDVRPTQNWLLLADYAAQTQQQLWTAWVLCQRAFEQNRALARSIDAEFLRYIAATHHVSEAFKKVGISDNHGYAWIVNLPEYENVNGEMVPILDDDKTAAIVDNLCKKLDLSLIDGIPELTVHGLNKLGLKVDVISENTGDLLVGLTISTELNS